MSDEIDEDIGEGTAEPLPPKLTEPAPKKAKPGRKAKAKAKAVEGFAGPGPLKSELDEEEQAELDRLEKQNVLDAAADAAKASSEPKYEAEYTPKKRDLQFALTTTCICGSRVAREKGSEGPLQCERRFYGTESGACQHGIPPERVIFTPRPPIDIYG